MGRTRLGSSSSDSEAVTQATWLVGCGMEEVVGMGLWVSDWRGKGWGRGEAVR